ncbi:DUF5694 domain-containing protein [Microbulbifer sp. TYP-18]|uniref:DUF5694 domain-containing protein n=1 Tax=Microbulbifer sp. TYP-18 TaxID=3230024 RepID=UPI0034C5CD38
MEVITRILIGTLMLSVSVASWGGEADKKDAKVSRAAEVMLFGVFHFANPGQDVVKSEVIDVSTAENQQYLESLTERLAKQSPTHVMLECDPEQQEQFDQLFGSYLNGEHKLDINENQQLGFRIASKAGLEGVICYDERNVHWNGTELMEYMSEKAPERGKLFQEKIQKFSEISTYRHKNFSLQRMLRQDNDLSQDRENMNLYLMTNDIGAGDGFAGAASSVSWWHRNFRMYANIQAIAQPGTRVIAIAGSGHTAILKTLLATDLERKAWDVNDYL